MLYCYFSVLHVYLLRLSIYFFITNCLFMELLGFLFELIFFALGLYGYLLLSGRIKLTGAAEQNRALFIQNVGATLKTPALILAIFAGIALILHLIQFIKK